MFVPEDWIILSKAFTLYLTKEIGADRSVFTQLPGNIIPSSLGVAFSNTLPIMLFHKTAALYLKYV